MVPRVAPPATGVDGCSTASSTDSALPKMGWRSTSAGAAASLRLGWRHSILRWDRNDVAGFFDENIPRLLVLRRGGRRRHGLAERLGIDLGSEGRSKSTILA